MTTVVCDGNILIADRRTSSMTMVRNKEYKVYTDDSDKIVVAKGELTYKGKKIVAMAGAGDAVQIQRITSFASEQTPTDLALVFDTIKKFNISGRPDGNTSGNGAICRIIALCEDGSYFVFAVLSMLHHKNPTTKISITPHEKGKMTVIGSGGEMYHKLKPFIHGEFTPHEIFSFCTHTDKSSSVSYSEFSREGNSLKFIPLPDEKEQKAAVIKVQKSMKMYNPGLKPPAVKRDTA